MNCPDFRKSIEITDSRRVVTIASWPMATIDSRKFHVNIRQVMLNTIVFRTAISASFDASIWAAVKEC